MQTILMIISKGIRKWALLGLLMLATLACSVFGVNVPSATPEPVETVPAAATEALPTVTSLPTELPAPTATPLERPTFVPTPTGETTLPTPTLAATLTRPPITGEFPPLTFVWQISWELVEDNPAMAIATITITAAGGDGEYTYYHDDILQEGPTFSYEWASCKPRPGSVRVDSGDGQTLREDYFERSPCPATLTPTP